MNIDILLSNSLVSGSLLFVLGCIWGSFANVCIYRIPKSKNVIFPRSHCQNCQYMIPFYFNIPVLSWFILRGKCRQCSTKYSFRYPLVEFLVGLSFAGLFYRYGWSWTLLEYCIFFFRPYRGQFYRFRPHDFT